MDNLEKRRWATRSEEMAVPPPPLLSRTGLRHRLRNTFLIARGSTIRAPSRPILRCLYLHSVYDDRREHFRKMLSELRTVGRFIDASETLEIVQGKRAIHEPCFHLSFDDGFDNNYRNAFPILEELGIKATFFVPSRLIDTSDAEFLDQWWTRDSDPLPTRMMRWDWLREMSEYGHEIGSHTRTHARLSDISSDSERLIAEVEGSKRDIEDALGRACRFIAWPFGTDADIDQVAIEEIETAGFEGCFSAIRGVVEPGITSRFAIPRDQVESTWPLSHVRYFALAPPQRISV